MNSVQQFTTSSRASLATRTLGSVSLIILLIAALGMVRSSSLPDDEAIVAAARSPRGAQLPRSRAPARGEPARVGRCRGRRRCGGAGRGPLPGRRCAGPGSAAWAQGSVGRGACHCRLRHILRALAPPPPRLPPYEQPEGRREAGSGAQRGSARRPPLATAAAAGLTVKGGREAETVRLRARPARDGASAGSGDSLPLPGPARGRGERRKGPVVAAGRGGLPRAPAGGRGLCAGASAWRGWTSPSRAAPRPRPCPLFRESRDGRPRVALPPPFIRDSQPSLGSRGSDLRSCLFCSDPPHWQQRQGCAKQFTRPRWRWGLPVSTCRHGAAGQPRAAGLLQRHRSDAESNGDAPGTAPAALQAPLPQP